MCRLNANARRSNIDDQPWPDKKKSEATESIAVDIKVHPGALVFLAPNENHRRARRRA